MGNYFKNLNYTLGDEDATFEMKALPCGARHVMAVADCGSRLLPLLARRPARLSCVDISPLQLAMAKLRLQLLAHCDNRTYREFLGYTGQMEPLERRRLLSELPLDAETARTLEAMFADIDWAAPIYFGKFEQMLATLSKITRFITGPSAERIFDCQSLEEQRAYYRDVFPIRRWKAVIALLGNSSALNSLLYKGDFPKKNSSASYYAIYRDIFERLFTTQLARDNFFLQMIFLGEIRYPSGLPIECDESVYEAARAALKDCEVTYATADIFSEARKFNDLDFLSLSDVPSFLSDAEATSCLQRVRNSFSEGGLVVVRGHVRIVRPDLAGFKDVSHENAALARAETTQLWTINTYRAA